MKVAVIGAGNVGSTLGTALSEAGHQVMWGVRSPDKVDLEGGEVTAVGLAAQWAEVIVLAVPFGAVHDVLDAMGDTKGKILVDATNPLSWDNGPVHNPPPAGSAAAHIATLTQARVVKAFNTFGAEHMTGSQVAGMALDLYLAGDDIDAKKTVQELGESLGMFPVDVGPLRNATSLEHLAVLWIQLAMVQGHGRRIAFKLLT